MQPLAMTNSSQPGLGECRGAGTRFRARSSHITGHICSTESAVTFRPSELSLLPVLSRDAIHSTSHGDTTPSPPPPGEQLSLPCHSAFAEPRGYDAGKDNDHFSCLNQCSLYRIFNADVLRVCCVRRQPCKSQEFYSHALFLHGGG